MRSICAKSFYETEVVYERKNRYCADNGAHRGSAFYYRAAKGDENMTKKQTAREAYASVVTIARKVGTSFGVI